MRDGILRALKNSLNARTDVETGFDSLINRSPSGSFFLPLFGADIKIEGNTFLAVADRNPPEKTTQNNLFRDYSSKL